MLITNSIGEILPYGLDIELMKNGHLKYNLGLLSSQRTALMGICILFVLFCHAQKDGAQFPSLVLSALYFLDVGVDMFFLLSGIGIYYSLSKSMSTGSYSYLSFINKRLKRIIIPYLILETPFWIWFCIDNGYSPFHCLYYLSFASFWLEHIGLWFVALLLPLYFVSPILFKLLRKSEIWIVPLVLIPLIISICPNIFPKGWASNIFNNIQIVSSRVPCYVIGLWLGNRVAHKEKISVLWLVYLTIAFLSFRYIPVINTIYRGWIIAIVISALLSVVLEEMSKRNNLFTNSINKALTTLGLSTLYIYIFYDVTNNTFIYKGYMGGGGTKYFLTIVVLGIMGGLLYYYIENLLKTKR